MFETIIESLARSGRRVRVREYCLGYLHPVKAALSGLIAALLLTWARYLVYAMLLLWARIVPYMASFRLEVQAPAFNPFPYGATTVLILLAGVVTALARRWSIRKGRFLIFDVGAIVQFRAGWHIPCGLILAPGLLYLSQRNALAPLDNDLMIVLIVAGSIASVLLWEVAHDVTLAFVTGSKLKERAAIEFDLKEAIAQDQGAERWRVDRLWFDVATRRAVLIGDFSSPKAADRADEVVRKVKGVQGVRLVQAPAPGSDSIPGAS